MKDRLLVFSLLVFLVLAACSAEREPVRIGFLAGLSGRLSDLGEAGRNGAQIAVDEVNRAGGINGRQVELIVRDDAQDPNRLIAAFDELIAARVEVVVGPMTSLMAEAALPIANRSGVVLVSPTVTARKFFQLDDNLFLVMASTRDEAALSAEYHFRESRVRRVVAIHDAGNRAYTESWLAEFTGTFQPLGGEISAFAFDSAPDADLEAVVRNALNRRPDAILIIAGAIDTARLAQKVRERDGKMLLIASQWATTGRLIELGGRHVEGLVSHNYFDRSSPAEGLRHMRATYVERFRREPGFAGVAAYDATRVVLAAIARRASGQSLRDSLLKNGPFPGAEGELSFNRFGDSGRIPHVTLVRNGQFVTLPAHGN
jgi:branched-chain amino acid transport system substrate-binding protein